MINPVLIFGAGAVGKLALDVFASNNLVVYGFLDDNKTLHGNEIGEIPILGNTEDDGYLKLIGKKCDAFIAIENTKERQALSEMIKERRSIQLVNAIHKEATVSIYAELGHGNLISAGSRISAFAKIGDGCLVFPNAVIEANSRIDDHVTIGSGVSIGEGVEIENGAFIGPGATIISGIKIGKNASVGAGSVVLADVQAKSRVFGNPAAKV